MSKRFFILTNLLLTFISIIYPLVWLFSPSNFLLPHLIIILAFLWGIKAMQAVSWQRYFAIIMMLLLSVIHITGFLNVMYWYPIIINGLLLIIFGGSLFSSQTLIERLARIQTPNLSTKGIRYTRKVTQLWCGFFCLNIIICTVLIAFQQYKFWALYTGFISYLLMGLLMFGEWIVRQKVIAIEKKQTTD